MPCREPGSAYVVIPELSAGNKCTFITAYFSQTFTFGPGQLSTIQGPSSVSKEFNFADLPCPPPDIAADDSWFYNPAFNPAQTYAPIIAPFPQLFDLNPAFHNCTVGLNQGFDPPLALPMALGPTQPRGRFHGRDRKVEPREGSPINAHSVPRLPGQTILPAQG